MNNCVGHRNRKDFVQFLFYATTSQITAFGILIGLVVEWFRGLSRYAPPPHPAAIVVVTLDMILLLAVALAVAGLLWYQISCIVENLTTIDEYVMERQLRAARKKRVAYAWPYDMGKLIRKRTRCVCVCLWPSCAQFYVRRQAGGATWVISSDLACLAGSCRGMCRHAGMAFSLRGSKT